MTLLQNNYPRYPSYLVMTMGSIGFGRVLADDQRGLGHGSQTTGAAGESNLLPALIANIFFVVFSALITTLH